MENTFDNFRRDKFRRNIVKYLTPSYSVIDTANLTDRFWIL